MGQGGGAYVAARGLAPALAHVAARAERVGGQGPDRRRQWSSVRRRLHLSKDQGGAEHEKECIKVNGEGTRTGSRRAAVRNTCSRSHVRGRVRDGGGSVFTSVDLQAPPAGHRRASSTGTRRALPSKPPHARIAYRASRIWVGWRAGRPLQTAGSRARPNGARAQAPRTRRPEEQSQ